MTLGFRQPRPAYLAYRDRCGLLLALIVSGFVIPISVTRAESTVAVDTVYQSVGPNGEVVYSDCPPAQGSSVSTRSFVRTPTAPPPITRPAVAPPARNAAAEASVSMHAASPTPPPQPTAHSENAQLFSAQWCGYCRAAKAYLAAHHIAYEDYDIDTPAGRAAYESLGVRGGVPVIVWQDRKVRGFSRALYDALFRQNQ